MKGISKYYPQNDVIANDRVDFSVRQGEIHALAGENGAGKSTLMKLLFGMENPDEGSITIKGTERQISSPHTAMKLGMAMVFQHFRLLDELTVWENVVLGSEPRKHLLFLDKKKAKTDVQKLISDYGFNLMNDSTAAELTTGQKQLTEILKVLYRKADLLILDEPTSVLTEQEKSELFKLLNVMRSQGKTIILITHKTDEIKQIADRVSIMRKGKSTGTYEIKDTNTEKLSEIMLGREKENTVFVHKNAERKELLSLNQVFFKDRNKHHYPLENISFSLHEGEVLGITEVSGNGMSQLEDLLGGFAFPDKGTLTFRDHDISLKEAGDRRNLGIAYLPTDRLFRGSSVAASIKENYIFPWRRQFTKGFIMNRTAIEAELAADMKKYGIQGQPSSPLGTLSGGNIQKSILARELREDKSLLILCQPTWGIDLKGQQFFYKQIQNLKNQGKAILLLSHDLDEVLALSDRIMVMSRGLITWEKPNNPEMDVNRAVLGKYMLGNRN